MNRLPTTQPTYPTDAAPKPPSPQPTDEVPPHSWGSFTEHTGSPLIPHTFAELATKYPPKFSEPVPKEQVLAKAPDPDLEAQALAVIEGILASNCPLTLAAARDYLTDHPPEHPVPAILDRVKAEISGLGLLEPLLDIPGITDIYVNSPSDVWIDGRNGKQKTAVRFDSEAQLRTLATRLITSAGARLDDAVAANDVYNDRGQRIHAVLPPLAPDSTVLSIRLQPATRPTLETLLVDAPPAVGQVLRHLVEMRANFLISGGTGSGKTTLLNAMLSLSGAHERLVTLEDSPELQPHHQHVVRLVTKDANAEGRGAVGLQELIQQALRMGPDRLILGECRGAEIADLLMAMNTGHAGSGSTLHANSAASVPARVLAMGSLAGLSSEATSLQAATALDVVIHCEKRGGARRITEIAAITLKQGQLVTEPCCTVDDKNTLTWYPAGADLYRAVTDEPVLTASDRNAVNKHLGKHEVSAC
ncbi:CpaF family protein [Rothia sp. ZJ1223]|uniref:CpaF family protein n=1 Tax=Rothia sp. ZJ1223 TaxID=2811098 RepID=UPI001959C2D1|nr:ATPase, T2SS/T4P/T4SS family [Rothia sp. ZJ1223]MBM7051971.1 Flp pilus assembly complex ATPase component TadA [Rothia sp. ZJ1223]